MTPDDLIRRRKFVQSTHHDHDGHEHQQLQQQLQPSPDSDNTTIISHQDSSTRSSSTISSTLVSSPSHLSLEALSDDLIQEVMSFLQYRELLQCASIVSHRWFRLSSSDHLWWVHLELERNRLPAYTIRKRKNNEKQQEKRRKIANRRARNDRNHGTSIITDDNDNDDGADRDYFHRSSREMTTTIRYQNNSDDDDVIERRSMNQHWKSKRKRWNWFRNDSTNVNSGDHNIMSGDSTGSSYSSGGAKREFLNLLRMNAKDRSLKRTILNIMRAKRVFQQSYGIVLPILFIVGLSLSSLLFPLEGDFHFSGLFSIPWWFLPVLFLSLPSYLLILLSVLIDPFLLTYMRDRCYHVLGTQLRSESNLETVKSMNLLVWSLSWIPTSLVCIFLKDKFWPHVSYGASLSPIFAMFCILLLVPPIIWMDQHRRGVLVFKENMSVFVVYCLCAVISLFVVIQFGLISGKLDGTITVTWGTIFIPVWLMLTVLIHLCPITCFLSVRGNSEFFAGLSFGSCIMCVGVLPLTIFMILLSMKLDNVIQLQLFHMFLPLYVFEIVLLFLLLMFGLPGIQDGLPEM